MAFWGYVTVPKFPQLKDRTVTSGMLRARKLMRDRKIHNFWVRKKMSQEVLVGIFFSFGKSWQECVFCLFLGKSWDKKNRRPFFLKKSGFDKVSKNDITGIVGRGGAAAHFWIDLIDKWTLTWSRVVFPNYFPEFRYFRSYLRMNAIGLSFYY